MIKRALICGINYAGTPIALRGCINDATNMQNLVSNELGFTQTKMLLEEAATTQGILEGLEWLIDGVVPGDVVLFHFSGHGSQTRSNIEPDGLDEIICPIDINWRDKVIKDDDLKAIFSKAPNGVNVTVILDCCHSASGIDQEETLFARTKTPVVPAVAREGDRFMPMPTDVVNAIESESLKIRDFKTSRDVNRSAVLIAGCLPYQTAADALIAGQFQGAATYALLEALKSGKKTYREIAIFMTEYMVNEGFTQRPQLDGHPSLYDQFFLQPWGTADAQVAEVPPPGTWKPEPIAEPREDSVASILTTMVVMLLLLVIFI